MRARAKVFVKGAGIIGFPVFVVLFWWVHRVWPAHAANPPGRGVWIGIFMLCAFSGVSLAHLIVAVLWPRQTVMATGDRASMPFVMGLIFFGSILILVTREIPAWPRVAEAAVVLMFVAVVRTVHCRLPAAKPEAPRMTPAPTPAVAPSESAGQWDVFLSYRVTPDSSAVRRFAESLIRHGYRPWFAEYEISQNEWDDAEAIARKLAEGVAGSRYFLVFTNDGWAESSWCNAEMNAILGKLRGPDGARSSLGGVVAEVRLPPAARPHIVFPPLADVPHFTVETDILEVWNFVEQTLGWLKRRCAEEDLLAAEQSLQRERLSALVGGYSAKLGGLTEVEDVFDPAHKMGGHEVQIFSGHWLGRPVRLRITINPFRGRLRLHAGVPGASDDRAVHRAFVQSFREWLEDSGNLHPFATHVVQLQDGHSAFGMTSQLTPGPGSSFCVERRYVLSLHQEPRCPKCRGPLMMLDVAERIESRDIIVACENPACEFAESWPASERQMLGEMEYEFLTGAEQRDLEGSKRAVAELAPLMDAVVTSTRRRWSARILDWQAAAAAGFLAWVAAEGWRYYKIALASSRTQAVWAGLTGFMAANVAFAVASRPMRREIMRARYGAKAKLPLGSWFVRWWNVAKGTFLQSGLRAALGLWPAGVLAIVAIAAGPERSLAFAPALGVAISVMAVAAMSSGVSMKGPAVRPPAA